jgi:hypothetical protein
MRQAFVAPDDWAVLSCDYGNQELYIAAFESKDTAMLKAFSDSKTLPLLDASGQPMFKDGQQIFYPNPHADLHCLTAVFCCFPRLFEGRPEYEWVRISKDETLIVQKGCARDYGKKTNFGIAYMQTAQAMAQLNYVREEECAQWIKAHQSLYPEFHAWAQEKAGFSNARGWVENSLGRIRWTAEDNAKKAGASPARSGVNHCIQSMAAEQAKLALWKISERLEKEPLAFRPKLSMLVHDEIIVIVPGKLILDETKCMYDGVTFVPVYRPDEDVKYWAKELQTLMEEAQAETFNWELPGKADPSTSRFWAH